MKLAIFFKDDLLGTIESEGEEIKVSSPVVGKIARSYAREGHKGEALLGILKQKLRGYTHAETVPEGKQKRLDKRSASMALSSPLPSEPEVHYGTESPGPGWVESGPMKWVKTPSAGTPKIAVVGGGPAGLFTAYILQQRLPEASISLFESSGRLGGKVMTAAMGDGTPYEAGVAELYDYKGSKEKNPLRALIEDDLGLATQGMSGGGVVLRGRVLRDRNDLEREFGKETRGRVDAFHKKMAELMPLQKYALRWQPEKDHPWADKTFRDCICAECGDDPVACEYIETAVASDLATESYTCNGLNGIKNVLLDNDDYMQLYHIQGGIERLVSALASRLRADLRLNSRVVAIERSGTDAKFGLVGDEWHGPDPPGEGWAEVGRGPHGGKIWRKQGQEKTTAQDSLVTRGQAGQGSQKSAGQKFADFLDVANSSLGDTDADFSSLTEDVVEEAKNTKKTVGDRLSELVAFMRQSNARIYDKDIIEKSSEYFKQFENDIADYKSIFDEKLDSVTDAFDELATAMSTNADDEDYIAQRQAEFDLNLKRYSTELERLQKMTKDAIGALDNQLKGAEKDRQVGWENEADISAESLNTDYDDSDDAEEDASFENNRFKESGNPYRLTKDEESGEWYSYLPEEEEQDEESPQSSIEDSPILKKHIEESQSMALSIFFAGKPKEPTAGKYTVRFQEQGQDKSEDFDCVFLTMPNHWLAQVRFPDAKMKEAIDAFLRHYDLPAHYFRVTLLFERRWWDRFGLPGDFWMMDAFCPGCCVYDESVRWRRQSGKGHVLSVLIGGQSALLLCSANLTVREIAERVIDGFPADWRADARRTLLECRIDSYAGSINAQPGSWEPELLRGQHQPEGKGHSGVFLVCDAMFDSTLNAALISANTAIELMLEKFGVSGEKATAAIENLKSDNKTI